MTRPMIALATGALAFATAPLATFVGNTTTDGVAGALTIDPAHPQAASDSVKIDMRAKNFLDTEVEANQWITFETKRVEIAGPLEPGKPSPTRMRGGLAVTQKPVERVADTTVTWIKLTPAQVEGQKRSGFTTDNIKVRARLAMTFTDHGVQVPQLLGARQ